MDLLFLVGLQALIVLYTQKKRVSTRVRPDGILLLEIQSQELLSIHILT